MSLLGLNDGDEATYTDIAECIRMYSSAPTEDLHELWQRIVFSVLISNLDDHLRNHGFLYDGHFRYRSFGTSFILEFPAPRWVECAYTPPYEDDDEDFFDDEAEDDEPDEFDNLPGMSGDDSLDEAWSCPSKPPELW